MNYYNENDPQKAAWLRALIDRNVIASGVVDERSIEAVQPADLLGYVQCHFFAGIGIWSYVLRLAGWPDDREVWTGSCPCQPFSVAGKKKGTKDERHLWPAWFRLIAERRPVTIFGEQVADGDGQTWLDHVQADVEAIRYRIGSLTLPAAGFGGPHQRHRTYFVADTQGKPGQSGLRDSAATGKRRAKPTDCGATGSLVDASECGRSGSDGTSQQEQGTRSGREAGSVAIPKRSRRDRRRDGQEVLQSGGEEIDGPERLRSPGSIQVLGNSAEAGLQNGTKDHQSATDGQQRGGGTGTPGPANGFWADAEWIPTRGKIPGTIDWRPIEPGTFALAHGAPSRVLRLRGYGDGIVAPVAAEFIKAYLEIEKGLTQK